jgi:hypothetical protein
MSDSKPESKNPVGKPLWVPTKEILDKVESLAARGLNQEQIAHCIGIHPATLCDKKQVFCELDDALKKGKAQGIAHVTQALLNNIDLGNVAAQIFYLKSRADWKEAKHELVTNENQSLIEKLIDKL